ncbi:MAG: hypothetical protein ACTHON_05715 [Humibacter sp.]
MFSSKSARVLITVKASPEPSEKYGDTVCVAGVRLDTDRPEFIRLYPVPFRWMTVDQQFTKYDVIDAELIRPTNDKRPESSRVNLDSVRRESGPIKDMRARGAILEPLIGPTMCELREGVVANLNARSLGLVRVREVKRVIVDPGHPWSDAQQAKIDRALRQESLFGEMTPPELKPPRFTVRYEYFCETKGCAGHTQRILDWELTAFQLRLRQSSNAAAADSIRRRFHEELCAEDKRVHFYVGNMADPAKRRNFAVLGVYAPPKNSDFGATLDLGM